MACDVSPVAMFLSVFVFVFYICNDALGTPRLVALHLYPVLLFGQRWGEGTRLMMIKREANGCRLMIKRCLTLQGRISNFRNTTKLDIDFLLGFSVFVT